MRIDIPANESWRALSDEYRSALGFAADPGVHVQVYAGYQHALYEATHGLARLFSHKRSIGLVEPAEPAIAQLAVMFAEETYNIRHWSEAVLDSIDASDLAFVLFSDDDPVTGRLYDHSRLLTALKDQRVFRIHVSHSEHRFLGALSRPAPFEARILSLSPERAVLIAGERFRVQPQLAPMLPWKSHGTADEHLARVAAPVYDEQKARILDFESRLPQGLRPYFTADEKRVFDRAVIIAEGVDGSAVIDEIARVLNHPLTPAGTQSDLETTSPCRWNHPRFTDWLLRRGETEEIIRGLIALTPQVLTADLPDRLAATATLLRSLQG